MKEKENRKKQREGVTELQKYVDNLVVIPNQNIFAVAGPDSPVTDSLHLANNVLIDGVRSIIDLWSNPEL